MTHCSWFETKKRSALTPVMYSTRRGMSVVCKASMCVHAFRRTAPMPFSKASKLACVWMNGARLAEDNGVRDSLVRLERLETDCI